MIKKLVLIAMLQLTAFTANAAIVAYGGNGAPGVLDLSNPVDSDQMVVLFGENEQLSNANPINFQLNNTIQGSNVLATFTLNRFESFQDFQLNITGDGALTIDAADFNVVGSLGTYELTLDALGTGSFDANFSGSTVPGATVANFTWVVNTPASVPVPAAVWLFGSALVGMSTVGRRRKKV